ncbi:hypothetical protein [Undibacterium sp.]|uniref:hypothetical protein n=1 Tax=Undibacterium sp. TaxID=1914977 RepID=UPI002BF63A85|nr:hypothetical protein [Undibacterium sp.]HTD05168.1 hypothetical protein [Undibacterium sp.]
MKTLLPGLLSLAFSVNCLAQSAEVPIDLPVVKEGDSWTYRITSERGANGWEQNRDEIIVSRVTSSSIYFASKRSGSTQPAKEVFSGMDWSRVRDVNGKETVVNKPLSFPLSPGKTWDVQYLELHPNKMHKSEQWNNRFKVMGVETVEVPAGKFRAIKIESEGRWTAELEPGQAVVQSAQTTPDQTTMVTQLQKTNAEPVAGRTYKAFWYAPEVKRWVKSVEEYYSNSGVRNERYTGELESYKLSQ